MSLRVVEPPLPTGVSVPDGPGEACAGAATETVMERPLGLNGSVGCDANAGAECSFLVEVTAFATILAAEAAKLAAGFTCAEATGDKHGAGDASMALKRGTGDDSAALEGVLAITMCSTPA